MPSDRMRFVPSSVRLAVLPLQYSRVPAVTTMSCKCSACTLALYAALFALAAAVFAFPAAVFAAPACVLALFAALLAVFAALPAASACALA